jgi:hypothetical protein
MRSRSASGCSVPTISSSARSSRGEWKLDEAEQLYLRTLGIRERALGAAHPAVAETLLQLEKTYLALGNNGEADRMHRRAVAILPGQAG